MFSSLLLISRTHGNIFSTSGSLIAGEHLFKGHEYTLFKGFHILTVIIIPTGLLILIALDTSYIKGYLQQ